MISLKEFIETLKVAHDVPNYYCNKYPKNLGYFDGKKYSFDCWNLIKVILSGWKPTGIPGSKGNTKVTGDVDGKTLLSSCSNRSKDFASLSVPGTYLYLSSNPHAGIFVGEFSSNGKTYNVIECTKGMYAGQDGVTYSYVDKDGTRRAWKGGNAKLKWSEYGLLSKYVDYGQYDIPATEPAKTTSKPVLKLGSKGKDVRYLQEKLNALGYNLVVDGEFGPKTEGAVKDFQKSYKLTKDGIVGPLTWDKLESVDISEPAKTEEKYYTVKYGDTFGGIARKCNIKESELKKLNPEIKNYNLIYAGQKIRVQ